jgi:hypothetical protein
MLMAITYGKGRVFHTTLGHDVAAMSSVDFGVVLQRGTEWAATGKVTQKIPPALSAGPNVVSYRFDLAKMDPNYGQPAAGPGGTRGGTPAGGSVNLPAASGAGAAPAAPSAGRGQGGPSGDPGGCVAR